MKRKAEKKILLKEYLERKREIEKMKYDSLSD